MVLSLSMTLEEATRALQQSSLHAGPTSYPVVDLHRAIRGSGNYFMRETRAGQALATVATVSGNNEVDIKNTLPDFQSGYVYDLMYIDTGSEWRPLRPKPMKAMLELFQDSYSQTGIPEFIHVVSPDQALLWPKPDAVYSIKIPYVKPLTPFVIGTRGDYSASTLYDVGDVVKDTADDNIYQCIQEGTGQTPNASASYWSQRTDIETADFQAPVDVLLNLPYQYVDDWIRYGAYAEMFYGLPDHPEAGPARQHFERVIEKARDEIHLRGEWTAGDTLDRYSNHPEDAYVD